MPMPSYTPDYHFGGPPTAAPIGFGAMPPPPPGFTSGPLGPPEGDWDDDDTRETDMVYGNLEVSPGACPGPESSRSNLPCPGTELAPVPLPRPFDIESRMNNKNRIVGYRTGPRALSESITPANPLNQVHPGERRDGGELPGSVMEFAARPDENQLSPVYLATIIKNVPPSFKTSPSLTSWYIKTATAANHQVKHRRRTTPDQLRVLEYWFSQNPKPDNILREWLANELGMTKRASSPSSPLSYGCLFANHLGSVQVWYQNRRAKISKNRGQALKDMRQREANGGSESDQSAPLSASSSITPIVTPERQGPSLLPPAIMGRRVSIANGEAAHISAFIQKRQNVSVFSPGRSPSSAQLHGGARRGSIPYPTPSLPHGYTPNSNPNPLSPKASPIVKPMPSQLHLAAMRNNTRRASMPGAAAQLISSGPFTPPRNISGQGIPNMTLGRVTRELSPIKDYCEDSQHKMFGISEHVNVEVDVHNPVNDFSPTFLTPPSSTYFSSGGGAGSVGMGTDSTMTYSPIDTMPFTPMDIMGAGPLPNPSFQFGQPQTGFSTHSQGQGLGQGQNQGHGSGLGGRLSMTPLTITTDDQIYTMLSQRGRMGSIASIGTYTTENGTDSSDWSGGDWLASPEGLESASRRSSG